MGRDKILLSWTGVLGSTILRRTGLLLTYSRIEKPPWQCHSFSDSTKVGVRVLLKFNQYNDT